MTEAGDVNFVSFSLGKDENRRRAVKTRKELFGSGRECRHPAKAILQVFLECAVGGLQQDGRNASKDIIAMVEDPIIPDGVETVFGHRF